MCVGEDTAVAVGMSALRPGSPAHCAGVHWELGEMEPNMGMRPQQFQPVYSECTVSTSCVTPCIQTSLS